MADYIALRRLMSCLFKPIRMFTSIGDLWADLSRQFAMDDGVQPDRGAASGRDAILDRFTAGGTVMPRALMAYEATPSASSPFPDARQLPST
ncbi:MAG TPA: hypothetical protein VKT70_10825 [Stellaceae bacterium]|nr:hypothetical protein [Stellaceae bacterium]